MRAKVLALLLVGLLLPATAAHAVLTLHVRDLTLRAGESGFLEVFFTEVGTPQDERLVEYTVALDIVGPPRGPTFGDPTLPSDNRPVLPGAPLTVLEATGTRVRVSVDGDSLGENISTGEGVLRVPVHVPVNPGGPVYSFILDLAGGATTFADATGAAIPFAPDNGVTWIPEPSAAWLATACGAAALCRRRRGLNWGRESWGTRIRT